MPKIDLPVTEKKPETEFVTVPEIDLFDQPFPTIRLSRHEFHAGKTYELDPATAGSLKDRIKAWEKANVRILQPRKDLESERVMHRINTIGAVPSSD